jgi:TPR repeat protein
MTEELLHRGRQCESAGDLAGAEAAYREADESLDAEAAILLGLLLKRRGDLANASDAFARAETRGHPEAASSLGNLLWDNGDLGAAKLAFERSIAMGSADAVLNLGLLLAQEGSVDEALLHLRAAEANGSSEASWAVGRLLEGQDDLRGAADAYRRAADAGEPNAAFGLGSVLMKSNDREGARAAFQRAHDLGHDGAAQVLQMLDEEADAAPSTREAGQSEREALARWAQLYATACQEVLGSFNACLEVANQAIGARNMAAKRPQHEISIQSFANMAEKKEREFVPLYGAFEEACTNARDLAANFVGAVATKDDAEFALMDTVGESVADNVALAKAVLSADYRSTPAGFLDGLEQTNALIQGPPLDGNIYTPATSGASGERTCPWCAETIKAAAVICRFCGRDVQSQPNVAPSR